MSRGAHVHRWTLSEPDGADVVHGRCACGERRTFDPWAAKPAWGKQISLTHEQAPVGRVNTPPTVERRHLRKATA